MKAVEGFEWNGFAHNEFLMPEFSGCKLIDATVIQAKSR